MNETIEETAFTPELLEKFRRRFETDDRVEFNMNGVIRGTGTILGLALDNIVLSYIVLLDEPLYTMEDDGTRSVKPQRAILVSNTLMTKLDQ